VWRCGFCGRVLESWRERGDHIGGHFGDGVGMAEWDEVKAHRGLGKGRAGGGEVDGPLHAEFRRLSFEEGGGTCEDGAAAAVMDRHDEAYLDAQSWDDEMNWG
jgi:hypothetical protein